MSDQEGQVLWCSLVFFDFLWVSCSLGFSGSGVLWWSLGFSGILWVLCSLGFSGVLWDSLGFSGILWNSLGFADSLAQLVTLGFWCSLGLVFAGGAGSLVFLDGNDGRARIRLVSIQWVSLGIVAIILYGATGHLL